MGKPDDNLPEESPVVTATGDDGQERSFLLHATLKFQDRQYAVLYPHGPEAREITHDTPFFVLDEKDTLSEINTGEILAQLDRLMEDGDLRKEE